MARGIDTRCLHLEEEEGENNNYGALSYPIYQTATYAHPGVGQSTGYDYSRLQWKMGRTRWRSRRAWQQSH